MNAVSTSQIRAILSNMTKVTTKRPYSTRTSTIDIVSTNSNLKLLEVCKPSSEQSLDFTSDREEERRIKFESSIYRLIAKNQSDWAFRNFRKETKGKALTPELKSLAHAIMVTLDNDAAVKAALYMVEMDIRMADAMLHRLTRYLIKKDEVELAYGYFARIRGCVSESYVSLIQLVLNSLISRDLLSLAVHCVDKILSLKLPIDSSVYQALAAHFVGYRKFVRAFSYFKNIRQKDYTLANSKLSYILAMELAQHHPKSALILLEGMIERKVAPDHKLVDKMTMNSSIILYPTLDRMLQVFTDYYISIESINRVIKNHDYNVIKPLLVRYMASCGRERKKSVQASVIIGMINTNKVRDAKNYFLVLYSNNELSLPIYISLIKYCGRTKIAADIDYIHQHFLDSGLQGNLIYDSCLIGAYAAIGRINEALKMLDVLSKDPGLKLFSGNSSPCVQSYTVIIKYYCENNVIEKATEILLQMAEQGVEIYATALLPVLRYHLKNNDLPSAQLLMEDELLHMNPLAMIEFYNIYIKRRQGDIYIDEPLVPIHWAPYDPAERREMKIRSVLLSESAEPKKSIRLPLETVLQEFKVLFPLVEDVFLINILRSYHVQRTLKPHKDMLAEIASWKTKNQHV